MRDNPDGEDIEYPPPQPLDGEIDRLMDTDNPIDFVVGGSDGAIVGDKGKAETSKHPASDPTNGKSGEGDDVEELESEEEEDEEEDDGEISLDEEELDEEEAEGDEEMQDVDAADEDVTMQSIEHPEPKNQPVVPVA
jgi:hypothetical protein